jgi:hypothetical protein
VAARDERGRDGDARELRRRDLRQAELPQQATVGPPDAGRAGTVDGVGRNDSQRSPIPTATGQDLSEVLLTLGRWAERWTELTTEHSDPEVVVWCHEFLRRDLLPDRRVVVRFDFSFLGRKGRGWLLIERREGELCPVDPGFGDDLVVTSTIRWCSPTGTWDGSTGRQRCGPAAPR